MNRSNKAQHAPIKRNKNYIPYHHPAIFDRTHILAKNNEGVSCAIICFTALEAFINDLISFYDIFTKTPVIFHENDHPANNYLNDEEQSILSKLRALDKSDIFDKLDALGSWNKSEITYQNLKELHRLRNNLVHLKAEEIVICDDTGSLSGYPKFLNNFFQKKIIREPKILTSWIELIETREFCLWCQDTTYQIFQKATDMLPDSNIKCYFKDETFFRYDSEKMQKNI